MPVGLPPCNIENATVPAGVALGTCTTGHWVAISSAEPSKAAFFTQLLLAALRRRGLSKAERTALQRNFGGTLSRQSGHYGLLKQALFDAERDAEFTTLTTVQRGLWLEFGVFAGLSANVTSISLSKIDATLVPQRQVRLHGFDTFTGLPKAWAGRAAKHQFSWEELSGKKGKDLQKRVESEPLGTVIFAWIYGRHFDSRATQDPCRPCTAASSCTAV